MKRLFLLFAMLAIAGMTMAQDVYYSGYFTSSGQRFAAVYKNGQLLKSFAFTGTDCESTSVVVKESTGDYYWVENTPTQGYVIKNTTSTPYLSAGANSKINALTIGNSLFSAGYKKNSNGVKVAGYWQNDGSIHELGNGTNNSEALGVYVIQGGALYTCGYQYTSSSAYNGVVWKNSNTTPVVSVPNVMFYDVTFYDGHVWAVGQTSGNKAVVYQDNTLKYTLTSTENSCGYDIKVNADDVYVTGWNGSTHVGVWKNGESLYDHVNGSAGYLRGLWVNTNDVYYVGCDSNNHGIVYKNGEVLYNTNQCEYLYDIYVTKLECEDPGTHTLPYTEGFERGDTEWECWTTVDVDNQNTGNHTIPFWNREGKRLTGIEPYAGDYCAYHGWGVNAQEGWLISPKFFLQPGRGPVLYFMSRELSSSFPDYRGVWVSTTTNSVSNFTEVKSITNPSGSWHQVYVDLSAYEGQTIYIAFKYTGTDGIGWCIDDIELYEEWAPCSYVASVFPYEQHFNNNIFEDGTCWCIVDNDHSGGMKCWQYDATNHCAKHPYGQSNGGKQEGWLISEKMQLTTGMNYSLSFKTKIESSGNDKKNSVWIAVDPTNYSDPSCFTMIWEETSYSNVWEDRTIDLTSYAGHVVCIAFKYEGTYAHYWYVDDIVVSAALPQYNINVEANNTAYGNVTGGGVFDQGTSITINAMAYSGYEFKKWTKNGEEVSTNANYTFTVNESATYVAVFGEPTVNYYNITTNVNPAEGGTVYGANTYAGGSTATLVANPNPGWYFVRWQDNNTENPRTITVTGDASYTAFFEQQTFHLDVTANPANGGTVTGTGTYPYGQTVELTAEPAEGFEFLNWNDGITQPNRWVAVIEDANYVAYFIDTTTAVYNITAIPNDITLGEVTGGGSYPDGAEITLTANAFEPAVFVRWNDGSETNPRTIKVQGDASYMAIFEMPEMHTITVQSANSAMGTVSGGGSFPLGAEIVIQANPLGGFFFDGWADNNYENPRTVTVTGDATYIAKFSASQSQTFSLTTTCNPMQGYVDGTGNYPAGTTVTITATPYSGFVFTHWNDNNTSNPRTVTVNDNITLVAFFSGTGVDENSETVLSLYPNPAKECIRIEGLESNSEVVFYNVLGMMVKHVNATADQEINVSDLASGVYMVRCGNQILRFVKE